MVRCTARGAAGAGDAGPGRFRPGPVERAAAFVIGGAASQGAGRSGPQERRHDRGRQGPGGGWGGSGGRDDRDAAGQAGGGAAGTEPDRQFVVALARGLEVLGAFRMKDGALGNSEIAARTGMPAATVSRITPTLTRLGYLTFHPRT
ncbi:MAG TPA: helix-turn-helix domain-containing protein, partial [Paracoccaceae bacterium]|nr:helix-turn-helix domain-containing protein [Paracoccaceae bacterium]